MTDQTLTPQQIKATAEGTCCRWCRIPLDLNDKGRWVSSGGWDACTGRRHEPGPYIDPAAPDPVHYARWVERVALALHEDCQLEWQAIAVADPERQITMHADDAHYGKAHDLVRRLGLEGAVATPAKAVRLLRDILGLSAQYRDQRAAVVLAEARRYLASTEEGPA